LYDCPFYFTEGKPFLCFLFIFSLVKRKKIVQYFTVPSGTEGGINAKVNDDVGIAEQHIPSIAIDNNGNFIIVWQDGRNDWQSDIYYQCYDSSGKKQGTNIKVNDDVGIVSKTHPSIVMDGGGNFVIVWIDARNFKNDIYFQYYNHDGTPRGTNVKVNDEIGTINFILQSIAMDVDGKFVIVWQDHRY
jgi:hypothetical protein